MRVDLVWISLTILEENIEQDDADLVVGADVGVKQDRHDGPHGVLNFLAFCICSHGQVLHNSNSNSVRVCFKTGAGLQYTLRNGGA